jgi:hypothetical protein
MDKPRPCPFCGEEPYVGPVDWRAEGDAWASVDCENDDCPVKPSLRNYANLSTSGAKSHEGQKRHAIAKWNAALRTHAGKAEL